MSWVRHHKFTSGLILGLLVGLLIGWVIWPVKYVNTVPADLREADRLDYILLVSHDYLRTRDAAALERRLATFDPADLPALFQQAMQVYGSNPDDVTALKFTYDVVRASLSQTGAEPAQPAQPAQQSASTTAQKGWLRSVVFAVLLVIGIVMLIVAIRQVWRLLRGGEAFVPGVGKAPGGADWSRGPEVEEAPEIVMRPEEVVSGTAPVEAVAASEAEEGSEEEEEEAPVSTLVMAEPELVEEETVATSVEESEDQIPPPPTLRLVETFSVVFTSQTRPEEGFDNLFSIEENGHNFGECGISEETLDNDPQQIIGMEVWLFDKQDTHTRQAYLLSPWAYEQANIRHKYEEKGKVLKAAPNNVVRLTSHSLYLEAEIKDVTFLDMPDGRQKVINKLIVEMNVHRRLRV